MSADDDHKPGENCAKDMSRTIWECFGGLKKITEDFYAWWDKTRGENAAIGVLVAILVILAVIFILLPAAFVLLIIAGVLAISAVIIDAVYKDKDAAPAKTEETEAKETPAEEKV